MGNEAPAPPPPTGYTLAGTYDESRTRITRRKQAVAFALLLPATLIGRVPHTLAAVFATRHDLVAFLTVAGALVFALVVVAVVHEGLHAAVDRYFGYDPRITWTLPNPNVTVREQFVHRTHSLVGSLTPLIAISTPTLIGAWVLPIPVVAFTCALIFLLNTTMAGGDLYNTYRELRRPPDTLWYLPATGKQSYLYHLEEEANARER